MSAMANGNAGPPPEFTIGLCMAGAISGGAYTAGVVDFLLEALEEWEKRRADPAVPAHRVKIKAMSGASAGGMVTAILARALATGIAPVRNPATYSEKPASDLARQTVPYLNPLFVAWVENIDLRQMLTTRDLADKSVPAVSALDSTVLGQICHNVLSTTGAARAAPPPYVAEPLEIFFTTTNLRGVAYGIPLSGEGAGYRHMMTAHADVSRFHLAWQPIPRVESLWLDPAALADSGNWHALTVAALASGAFPVGLAPRLLSRKAAEYHARKWTVPRANPLCHGPDDRPVPEDRAVQLAILGAGNGVIHGRATELREVPPIWPPGIAALKDSWDYAYWNVDGGVMNNEPMEFVRRALAGKSGRNERAGSRATNAVLMIDPFPNESPLTPDNPPTLGVFAAAWGLISALVAQARFKTEDLTLALDESVFSRYIIYPTYGSGGANFREPAMCAAVLGGFGGFLAEAFRRHDFALGRRNCQNFLRRHFALLENNPLFNGMAPAVRDRFYIRGRDGQLAIYGESDGYFDGDGQPVIKADDPDRGQKLLPVIPLVGTAAEEIALPAPRPTARDVDREALHAAITARLEALVPRLLDEIPNAALRVVLKGVWHGAWLVGQRHKLTDLAMAKIDRALAPLDR